MKTFVAANIGQAGAHRNPRPGAARQQSGRDVGGYSGIREPGDGRPVLAVHDGAGGGYDQGLLIAASFLGGGFKVIAPSRFGYLRTPVPVDASPAAQADAHAALLDWLGVDKAVVVGVSAGAPSATQLALRHPDRVAALILVVPGLNAPGHRVEVDQSFTSRLVAHTVMAGADFAWWSAMKFAPAVDARALPRRAAGDRGGGAGRRASGGQQGHRKCVAGLRAPARTSDREHGRFGILAGRSDPRTDADHRCCRRPLQYPAPGRATWPRACRAPGSSCSRPVAISWSAARTRSAGQSPISSPRLASGWCQGSVSCAVDQHEHHSCRRAINPLKRTATFSAASRWCAQRSSGGSRWTRSRRCPRAIS